MKAIFNYTILAFTIITAISACTRKVTKQEMLDYIKNPENGLTKQKSINNVDYKLTYRPSDLFVLQETEGDTSLTEQEFEEIYNRYHQNAYFILSISQNKQEVLSNYAGNQQQFGAMVNQLAFGMNEKVFIKNRADTIYFKDYVYPRLYGMKPSTDILFAFAKEELTETETFDFYIKDLGLKTGDIKFKFTNKDIKNIPELKY